jgi:hypothetical protein
MRTAIIAILIFITYATKKSFRMIAHKVILFLKQSFQELTDGTLAIYAITAYIYAKL